MNTEDYLGEIEVTEMSESRINGSTAVKYNYLTQNDDEMAVDVRYAERAAVG